MTATTMTAHLRSVPDTEAAVGWTGGHTVFVDRPDGKAGGRGLGFNGGQLLALAIGGCFCNDLHYVAHDLGVRLVSICVNVTVTFEGRPLVATRAVMEVDVVPDGPVEVHEIIRRAREISTVSNTLQRGLPVEVVGCS